MNHFTVRPAVTCVPITAIYVFRCGSINLVLSGQGGDLHIHELTSCTPLRHQNIFPDQAIHGIRKCNEISSGSETRIKVLILGSSLISYVELIVAVREILPSVSEICVLGVLNLGDWILHGTALPGEKDSATVLTTNNILHQVELSTDPNVGIHAEHLGTGPSTFLYSGYVLAIGANAFLVASGTVFGEVLFWSCQREGENMSWKVIPKYIFKGHQGSIFGVCISDTFTYEGKLKRVLASCSDDRTIMLWDVTECEYDPAFTNSQALKEKTSDFAEIATNQAYLAMTWGHFSRIWGVHFPPWDQIGSPEYGNLVSRGEDGSCQVWRLYYKSLFGQNSDTSAAIQPFHQDRHHVGKNIWSLTFGDSAETIYSGGADGQIISRAIDWERNLQNMTICSPFKDVSEGLVPQQQMLDPNFKRFKALKTYLIVTELRILATTNTGLLVEGALEENALSWRVLAKSKRQSLFTLSVNSDNGLAFFVDSSDYSFYMYSSQTSQVIPLPTDLKFQPQRAQVVWSQIESNTDITRACVLVSSTESVNLQMLWVTFDGVEASTSQTSVSLPETFIVSSCFYSPGWKLLVLGSKSGAMAACRNVQSGMTSVCVDLCLRHIHNSDTVTSIIGLPMRENPASVDIRNNFILTTGRDGTYAILQFQAALHSGCQTNNLHLKVVHQGTTSISPFIEGALVTTNAGGATSLILYGFRSKDFVVWDESKQLQLLSIDCGGAHRSWAYSQPAESSAEGIFVFTKAGIFNLHKQSFSSHRIIQDGGHGREIKAVAVHQLNNNEFLIATGAEDTDIRLFKYEAKKDDSTGSLKMLVVLRRHTTGLQALRFSPCGKYLFSAAGMEELYMWELHDVPIIEVGVKFLGEVAPEGDFSDARLMSFDLRTHQNEQESQFTVVAAYSSGKLRSISKTVHGDCEEDFRYHGAAELDFGALCLSQVSLFQSYLSKFPMAVVGATNGYVHLYAMSETSNHKPEFRGCHKIHQSNVSALIVAVLGPECILLVTGGDDNALAITLVVKGSSSDDRLSFRTLKIPKVHAAALTAITVLPQPDLSRGERLMIATAANDQKVKVWSINVHRSDTETRQILIEDLQIELIGEYWTSVADISGMELLSLPTIKDNPENQNPPVREWEVIVVGVGMQILSLHVQAQE